jgi:hypothetical protein
VVLRDPALIIRLLGLSTSSNSRSIRTNDRDLVLRSHSLLGATGRTLGALATLSAALGLWEQGFDPGLVDEVESSGEGGEEEEVQEDAANELALQFQLADRGHTFGDQRCW